jgi:hypothetical protein
MPRKSTLSSGPKYHAKKKALRRVGGVFVFIIAELKGPAQKSTSLRELMVALGSSGALSRPVMTPLSAPIGDASQLHAFSVPWLLSMN